MELTYHWGGDVLIPDLELEDGSNYQIGKYGRMQNHAIPAKWGIAENNSSNNGT